jgi:1-hydroxycarotenoid 3,4-desaturase
VAGRKRVIVVGAGIAGLTAALRLALYGLEVTVIEKAGHPGGKMREVEVDGARMDAGPTVFTLPHIFEEIFAEAGATLSDHVTLRRANVLARHAWTDGSRLDLFADIERSANAINALAGSTEAEGYRRFCAEARRTWTTLESSFVRSPQPSIKGLVESTGLRGLGNLWRIRPFDTLWGALGDYFHDPRLRQLFGRYATYCGSSPFQAPATLMLVAHVEQEGVWLVEGGMARVAQSLADLASRAGASFRYGLAVQTITANGGRADGVELTDGERIGADAIVVNADTAALALGLFGAQVARAVPPTPPAQRSLSAVTWNMVAEVEDFPLSRHTVFFSDDYQAEFDDIFGQKRLPARPTVYVCAQDRDADTDPGAKGPERLMCLINAPPNGDAHTFTHKEIEQCATRTFGILTRCGLRLKRSPERTIVTTPTDWNHLFPGTGGALYGPASHGWKASFSRPTAQSRIPGLYLAGGSTHPGPGVPMAALSGRIAAGLLLREFGLTNRSSATDTRGGTSTR